MTKNPYLDMVSKMSKEEVRVLLKKVMGPPRRTLEGKERDDILLLLSMIEPYSTSNNQHSWTECYMIGNKDYHVTIIPGEEEIVDLILEDDDETNM